MLPRDSLLYTSLHEKLGTKTCWGGVILSLDEVYARMPERVQLNTTSLSSAFPWDSTPQGYDYWGNVNQVFRNIKKEKVYAAIYE